MFKEYIRDSELQKRVLAGIGGAHLAGFAAWLEKARYAAQTVRCYVLAVGHFICWATAQGFAVSGLDESALDGFGAHLESCQCEGLRLGYRFRLRVGSFIRYLRLQGVVPPPKVASPATSEPALFEEFRCWMLETRGVREATVKGYSRAVLQLLETLGDDPTRYDAESLREFIRAWSRSRRRGAKDAATSIRMFFRFLSSRQRCSPALVYAIPSVAQWSQASLPQYLPVQDIKKVLQATEQSKHPLRNRAIILLLYCLALRAGDIIRLELKDIDWHRAILRTLGKGRRESELPLTQEVGEALEAYILRERPAVDEQRVFLRGEAPFRPLASQPTVSAIVRLSLLRAGVEAPSYGAHILRRSAATHMLGSGASLTDIATILRHRSVDTTMVYAKVDIPSLKLIVQPWPEVPSC